MAVDAEDVRERRVGRYVLYGEIASGGMAHVHLGRLCGQVGFVKTVAIKRLSHEIAKDERFRTMFVDEARLAARMQHRNVVSTFDVVEEDGELLLVMEYLHGESLARLLRAAEARGERMPLPIVASIASGILHGLHAAHEARGDSGELLGLVHRDVSPHNVLVGADGVARVVDFGIAKATGRVYRTGSGQAKGKVPYMAPEQFHGEVVDRRADIYSASLVIWEMLVGRRAFDGPNEGAVLLSAVTDTVDAPSRAAVGVDAALDGVVLRGLMRTPSARFSTAEEMAFALEACAPLARPSEISSWVERLAGDTLRKREAMVRAVEATAGSDARVEGASASGATRASPPKTRRLVAMGAAVLALGLAAGAIALVARRSKPETVPVAMAQSPLARVETSSQVVPAPSSPASVEPPVPPAVAERRPAAKRATPSRPATTKPPAVDAARCNPPYVLDADGHRVFKRECL